MSDSEFCGLHVEARKNVEDGYERWGAALGQEIARNDYLDQLIGLDETGDAVKNVIGYMRRKAFGAD